MKYTISITDNSTNEVISRLDTNAIIAGISESDKFSSLVLTSCNGKDIIGTIEAASGAIKNTLADMPKQLAILVMHRIASDLSELLEGEDDEDDEDDGEEEEDG